MKAEYVTVELRIGKPMYNRLKVCADNAGTTVSVVIAVIMALEQARRPIPDAPMKAAKK